MITATNNERNENKDQTLETESGFFVSKITPFLNWKKIILTVNENKESWNGEIPKFWNEKIVAIIRGIHNSKNGTIGRGYFKKIVTTSEGYKVYLNYLSDCKIISFTNSYSVIKHISKKYVINSQFMSKVEVVNDIDMVEFDKRIQKHYNRMIKKYNNWKNVFVNLSNTESFDILTNHFNTKKKLSDEERSEEVKKFYKDIQTINNGEAFGKFCNDTRFHSTFTGLPKCVRNLCYSDKDSFEELVEIDIHATHIFLLLDVLKNMLKVDKDWMDCIMRNELNRYDEMLKNCLANRTDIYSEFLDCYRAEMYSKTGTTECGIDRESIKTQILSWINNEKDEVYMPIIDKVFGQLYPKIKEYMEFKKNGKYNVFSTELLKMETNYIFEISKRVVKTGATLISVHDCLMFRKKDTDIVMKIIREVSKEQKIYFYWKTKKSTFNNSKEKKQKKPTHSSLSTRVLSSTYDSLHSSSYYNNIIMTESSTDCKEVVSGHNSALLYCDFFTNCDTKRTSLNAQTDEKIATTLNAQKKSHNTRNREAKITTDKNGRMWFSVKGKRYGSRKNESRDSFMDRINDDIAVNV